MKRTHFAAGLFGLFWIVLIAWGLWGLGAYATTPGEAGATPQAWPLESKINKSKDRHSLLVFLHPQCACSEATVEELDKLLAHTARHVDTHLVFIRPPDWPDKKLKGSLWKKASAIPHIRLLMDDSSEADLFGARTSGHTVLYSSKGKLEFAGGITGSRGHVGDNIGQSTVAEILQNKLSTTSKTSVFGCELFDHPAIAKVNQFLWKSFRP